MELRKGSKSPLAEAAIDAKVRTAREVVCQRIKKMDDLHGIKNGPSVN